MLLEHRIEHGPYTAEEAYRLLDDWVAGTGAALPPQRPADVDRG